MSDVAVIAKDYRSTTTGIAFASGEQPTKGFVSVRSMVQMSVGEALTNLVWGNVGKLEDVRLMLSFNCAGKMEGETAKLHACVRQVSKLAGELGIGVIGVKDSVAMAVQMGEETVKAPLTLVVTAIGNCEDVNNVVTPDIKHAALGSHLLFIDLSRFDEDGLVSRFSTGAGAGASQSTTAGTAKMSSGSSRGIGRRSFSPAPPASGARSSKAGLRSTTAARPSLRGADSPGASPREDELLSLDADSDANAEEVVREGGVGLPAPVSASASESPRFLAAPPEGPYPLGGSALAQVYSQLGDEAPFVEPALLKRTLRRVAALIKEHHVLAGHDRSDGGLMTTLLEMAFAGDW